MGTRIEATSMCVPPHVQTSEELAPQIGRDVQWILDRAGVAQRHVAEPDLDPAELAAEAAAPLMSGDPPDWIIHAAATRRQSIPDTSVFVQDRLGLRGIPSFSINATCLSFLAALQAADAMIAAGRAKRVLITCAELTCRVRDFSEPESAALLGDGAAAAMVVHDPTHRLLEHFAMETWPAGAELAEVRGGGHLRFPGAEGTVDADQLFHMAGDRLLRMAVPRMRKFMRRFWDACGGGPDDIDWVVPHQPSAAAMRVLSRLGFRQEQVIDILRNYGNCAAASMPMALAVAENEGRLVRGDRVLLVGTAAGLSLGAALVRW